MSHAHRELGRRVCLVRWGGGWVEKKGGMEGWRAAQAHHGTLAEETEEETAGATDDDRRFHRRLHPAMHQRHLMVDERSGGPERRRLEEEYN
ncbi:unnamed protein product [Lampetra planeri]